jgi:hypothetical protein
MFSLLLSFTIHFNTLRNHPYTSTDRMTNAGMKRKATDTGNGGGKRFRGARIECGACPSNPVEDEVGSDNENVARQGASARDKRVEEQDRDCPICFERLPYKFHRFVCCGKRICLACEGKCGSSSCPMCRGPRLTGAAMLLHQLWPKVYREKAWAQTMLGKIYRYGRHNFRVDRKMAAELFAKAAEQGYARAQSNLGIMYFNGIGVKEDNAKAAELFTKAAEQGHADAQCNLGIMYDTGKGVKEDLAKAVELYAKAAEQGYARAQSNLGIMYFHGIGVKEDKAKAAELFAKAAEQGHADAQCNLGIVYFNGEGVKKDKAKAVELYAKAAEQGHARAQCNLGIVYFNGEGVTGDKAKAAELYAKAAEQGIADAQNNLGIMYFNGIGVKEDKAKAAELFAKAEAQGIKKPRPGQST